MSLYSSLTQVLAPYAAKLNGLLTGWDGTTYSSPGEAVRQQIADLHVLIGDEPGTAIQGEAISYDGTTSGLTATTVQDAIDESAAALSNTNERLAQQQTAISEVEEKVPIVDAVAENYTYVKPDNWHNVETDTVGILNADGTVTEATNRYYTDYIAVTEGDVVRAYHKTTHNLLDMYNFTCYDSGKTLMPSAGRDVSRQTLTVPEGVSYIRITLPLTYQSATIITINFVPTDWNIQYFAPYYALTDDMLTEETKGEIDRLIESGGATLEPVKGYNLIPLAETGVGAYYASGNRMSFSPSYDTYNYAIIPVKEETRYYINRNPRWWGITDANGVVKASGTGLTPVTKRYVDVPTDGTTLYLTYNGSDWRQEATYGTQFAIIVAEGLNGASSSHKAPDFVTGITQRMRKTTYACALPKAPLRGTVGIEQKWYQKNMFSVDGNYASISASATDMAYNYKWQSFTPNSAGERSNGFYSIIYDDQMVLVDQLSAVTEYFYADNVADASALVIGDSTVDAGRETQTMLDMWTERGKTLTLLGTRGTAPNLHEGRSGASAKGYCTSTTTGGVSNPFYNSTENKFDFAQYMSAQGYSSVDFVVIQLGTNDIFNAGMGEVEDVIAESMGYICQIIDSILAFNPSQKILINLPAAVNPNASTFNMKLKHNIFVRFNAAMLIELTKYNTANVRVSYNHLRLDPETDINDHVHPTQAGYAKMGAEMFSQINAWQKG